MHVGLINDPGSTSTWKAPTMPTTTLPHSWLHVLLARARRPAVRLLPSLPSPPMSTNLSAMRVTCQSLQPGNNATWTQPRFRGWAVTTAHGGTIVCALAWWMIPAWTTTGVTCALGMLNEIQIFELRIICSNSNSILKIRYSNPTCTKTGVSIEAWLSHNRLRMRRDVLVLCRPLIASQIQRHRHTDAHRPNTAQ